MLPEQAARLEHARLQRLVHEVETMPRRHQLEAQRDQALAIIATERVQPARIGAGGQRPVLGQIVGADEAELAEVLVIGRQIDEQLDHGGGDPEADLDQGVRQAGPLEGLLHVRMRRKMLDVEGLVGRRAEQQVLGERGIGVVAIDVEHLDQAAEARLLEPLAHGVPRLEHGGSDLGLSLGIDRAAQAHVVDVAIQAHHDQRPHRRRHHLLGAAQARRLVVDPVRLGSKGELPERSASSSSRLNISASAPSSSRGCTRAMPQSEEQVVGDRAGEDLRRVADVGHLAAGHRLRQPGHLDVVDQHAPGVGIEQVGKDQQQLVLAAAGGPQDRDARRQLRPQSWRRPAAPVRPRR